MIETKNRTRKFQIVGDQVYHCYREGNTPEKGVYIKMPHEGTSGYGDVLQEYASYQKINSYLRMPHIHLMKDKNGVDVLVIEKVMGECLGDLFLKNSQQASNSLTEYTVDLQKMWQNSIQEMKSSKLAVDQRLAFAKRVESFFSFSEAQRFLNADSIVINGSTYTDLSKKLQGILSNLTLTNDPVMTLGHGDDHLGNILSNEGLSTGKYYIIDPKLSGYYSPAIAYHNAAMYLILYKFNFSIEIENYCGINYKVETGFKEAARAIIKVLKEMESNLSALSSKPFLVKEYSIANLLRFVQKLNDPKNLSHTVKNIPAYLAIAIELANNKYNTISEFYESIC